MATTTAFNSLSVPGPDENMEMSSPANRNLDDEIDIDFDDYPGGVQVADDEQMLEDGDPARPGTGTDDMMEDDILPGEQTLVEEEVMQDDGIQVQEAVHEEDEELIDYGEDEIHDLAGDDTLLPSVIEEPTEIVEPGIEQIGQEIPAVTIPEVPAPRVLEEITTETVQVQDPQADADDLFAHITHPEEGVHVEADDAFAGESHVFGTEEQTNIGSQSDPQADEGTALPPISVNTAVSAQTDTPGTPTDTGLHPMNIRYGDLRMPLFKSRRQPDGLLKDDNLASLSLAELIKNCRQRLAIKIGEDISEDQELILGFEHLGLMLVEDSRAAFESSLNDVLEVYLQLHRNDATQEIPPLSLTVSLQLKFASSFSILKQAAAGGQGMSTFGFLQPAGDEEYYNDEYEDGDEHTGRGLEQEQYDDSAEGDHANGADHQDLTGEYHDLDQTEEDTGGYEQDEFYFEEHEDYHDAAKDTYADYQDQAPPGLGDLLQGEHQLTDTINNALDTSAATGQDTVTEGTARRLDAALGTAKGEESRESSTTVQGDNVTGNTGEYDLIDWDDDTLTTELSAPTSDPHDDFSTFLTEFEADEQESAAAKDGQHDVENSTAQHVSELLEGEHADQTFDGQHLGSEDFLNDLGENDYGEQGNEEGYEPGQEHEQYGEEEEYYDQADTHGEQQDEEEYHTGYEPGEDDEQFHTAHQDFFDGGYYEHGPQHDIHDEEDEDALDDTVDTVVRHPVEEYDDDDEEEPREDFDEDDLGFDDETYEQQGDDDGKASRPVRSSLGSKRSFDEHADEDDLEPDEREVKKSRPS